MVRRGRPVFANHVAIKNALEVDFFFAKPHHPWERGSNENGNRLIRQYFPKSRTTTLIKSKLVATLIIFKFSHS